MSAPFIGQTTLPGTPTLQNVDGSSGGSGIRVATVTADFTLLATDAATQILTPAPVFPVVNITITLPSSATCPGRSFLIRSVAATNVTMTLVQSAADGGATIGFIAPGEEIWVGSTGAAATGFVRVQRDPTSANVNIETLAGAITLGATAARSRNYQRLTAAATQIVNLPLSDTTPGGWFLIENISVANEAGPPVAIVNLTVTPDAADPAGTTTIHPGEWVLFVSVPVAGYVIASRGYGNNVTVGDADVVLAAASTSVQVITPTVLRTVATLALRTDAMAGREAWVVHTGVDPRVQVNVLGVSGTPIASLGIGDVARVTGTVGGSENTIMVFRAQGVNVETLGAGPANKALVAGDMSVQLLDPNNLGQSVRLSTPALSIGKKFTIRNTGYDPLVTGDVIEVQTSAGVFVVALGPGDEADFVCSVAATGFQMTRLDRAQNTNVLTTGSVQLTALGAALDPTLAYPIQRLNPNASPITVRLPVYTAATNTPPNVELAQPRTIINTSTVANQVIVVEGLLGVVTNVQLSPGQQATFIFDESAASPVGAGGYRVLSAPLSGARAVSAPAGTYTIATQGFRFTSTEAAAGATSIQLPSLASDAGVLVARPGERVYIFVDNTVGGGGTVTLLNFAGGALATPVAVLNGTRRAVVVQNDGVAWAVVSNETGLA